MKTKLAVVVIAIALGCFVGPNAYASSITLSDFGLVGVANALPGDTGPEEPGLAQSILDLTGLGTLANCGTPTRPCQNSLVHDYSGTIVGTGVQMGGVDVPGGWTYALGKYDGHNAGYVLFYLPDYGYTLPMYSDVIWTNTSGEGYALSHFTVFNSVPDGGSLMMLLGMAFIGLAGARRMMK